MKKYLLILVLAFLSYNSFGAQDHNSTRSTTTSRIAGDTIDNLMEVEKRLSILDDDIDLELLKKVIIAESKTAAIKERMVIDTFIKLFLKNIKKYECSDINDEECLSKAIMSAEKKLRPITSGQRNRL